MNDDFYRDVARMYDGAVANGKRPARTIATTTGRPVTTVHRWIREARRPPGHRDPSRSRVGGAGGDGAGGHHRGQLPSHQRDVLGMPLYDAAADRRTHAKGQAMIDAEGRRVKILRNSARCGRCGDEIESKHRHDFTACSCLALCVDGGRDYLRRVYDNQVAFEETSVTEVIDEAP